MDREEFLKELEKYKDEKVVLVETSKGHKKEIIIELLQEDNKLFYVSDISEDVEFEDLKSIGGDNI